MVRGVVEGARRKLAGLPLSHDGIVDITFSLNTTSSSLADILFLFILLVDILLILGLKMLLSLKTS